MIVEVVNDKAKNQNDITIILSGIHEIRIFSNILKHAQHDFNNFNMGAARSLQDAQQMLNELQIAI